MNTISTSPARERLYTAWRKNPSVHDTSRVVFDSAFEATKQRALYALQRYAGPAIRFSALSKLMGIGNHTTPGMLVAILAELCAEGLVEETLSIPEPKYHVVRKTGDTVKRTRKSYLATVEEHAAIDVFLSKLRSGNA